MLEVGLLTEDECVELIGGEMVKITSVGARRLDCVTSLTRCFVSVQNPVVLGGDGETSVSLLRRHPSPESAGPPATDDGCRSARISGPGEMIESTAVDGLTLPADEVLA